MPIDSFQNPKTGYPMILTSDDSELDIEVAIDSDYQIWCDPPIYADFDCIAQWNKLIKALPNENRYEQALLLLKKEGAAFD